MQGVVLPDLAHYGAGDRDKWPPKLLRRLVPQPLVGVLVATAALLAVDAAWSSWWPPPLHGLEVAVLLCLAGLVVGSRLLPITVGTSTRLYFASGPLFLLCSLFPAPVAGATIGISMLAGEMAICRRCGNTVGDMLAQAGRWVLLSLGVSACAHAWSADAQVYGCVLAVALLWGGDVLTSPLVLSPMTGLRPWVVIRQVAGQSYVSELTQYFVAMLALLLYRSRELWTGSPSTNLICVFLIVVPIFLLYLYMKSVDEDMAADRRRVD